MSLAPTRPDTGKLLAFLREGGHNIDPSQLLGVISVSLQDFPVRMSGNP